MLLKSRAFWCVFCSFRERNI